MKHILISYDYFFPGFKAGGPIQSLVNLVLLLQKDYKVSVFTGAYDLNENNPYQRIKLNEWNAVLLPGTSTSIDVWYADTQKLRYKDVVNTLNFIKPDIIYINSMYSLQFLIYPLFAIKKLNLKTRIVICPRGMLQNGALQVKALKKKLFLKCFKGSGLLNNVYWHATNQEEKKDIKKHFPVYSNITVASNIPKLPYKIFSKSIKETGKLKLIYLSLISEKKNLHLLLQVLSKSVVGITLDIYGPIKDKSYWENNCTSLIKELGGRVEHKGEIQPLHVQEKFEQYHALALLTKGENFGHAIYECLSVGRPVITSYFTPWNKLTEKKAGWNVDILNLDQIAELLNELAYMDESTYESFTNGAHNIAEEYYYNQNFHKAYAECFF